MKDIWPITDRYCDVRNDFICQCDKITCLFQQGQTRIWQNKHVVEIECLNVKRCKINYLIYDLSLLMHGHGKIGMEKCQQWHIGSYPSVTAIKTRSRSPKWRHQWRQTRDTSLRRCKKWDPCLFLTVVNQSEAIIDTKHRTKVGLNRASWYSSQLAFVATDCLNAIPALNN